MVKTTCLLVKDCSYHTTIAAARRVARNLGLRAGNLPGPGHKSGAVFDGYGVELVMTRSDSDLWSWELVLHDWTPGDIDPRYFI